MIVSKSAEPLQSSSPVDQPKLNKPASYLAAQKKLTELAEALRKNPKAIPVAISLGLGTVGLGSYLAFSATKLPEDSKGPINPPVNPIVPVESKTAAIVGYCVGAVVVIGILAVSALKIRSCLAERRDEATRKWNAGAEARAKAAAANNNDGTSSGSGEEVVEAEAGATANNDGTSSGSGEEVVEADNNDADDAEIYTEAEELRRKVLAEHEKRTSVIHGSVKTGLDNEVATTSASDKEIDAEDEGEGDEEGDTVDNKRTLEASYMKDNHDRRRLTIPTDSPNQSTSSSNDAIASTLLRHHSFGKTPPIPETSSTSSTSGAPISSLRNVRKFQQKHRADEQASLLSGLHTATSKTEVPPLDSEVSNEEMSRVRLKIKPAMQRLNIIGSAISAATDKANASEANATGSESSTSSSSNADS